MKASQNLHTFSCDGTWHDCHNLSESLHLPRKLTFLTATCDRFLAPAMRHDAHVRKRIRRPSQTTSSKLLTPIRGLCASLRQCKRHRISKPHSCADETTNSERDEHLPFHTYGKECKYPSVKPAYRLLKSLTASSKVYQTPHVLCLRLAATKCQRRTRRV